MNTGKIQITYSKIRRIALIYISLPLICFFIGWLKWYWIILSCIALIVCLVAAEDKNLLNKLFPKTKDNKETKDQLDEKSISLSKWVIPTIALISCVYCIFCGIGRLWGQSLDYPWRNAIFRDLIMRDWPVFYDKLQGALSYYIGMWLPAAIPGKIVYLISGDYKVAFFVGNMSLLLYFTFGFTVLFLLLLMYFQKTDAKHVFLLVFGLILFSGMDIIGSGLSIPEGLHIEWWAGTFQYSSLTTCMCWVFNQTLVPWICTTLLLHEKSVSNLVFIGMACLFNGPFPFIGFFIYCIAIGIMRCVAMTKEKKGRSFVKEVFSLSNIFATLLIFPIISAFLLSNNYMADNTGADSDSVFFLASTWGLSDFVWYVFFLLIEFGIFAVLIARPNKKNVLFYVTVIQLCIYPLFNLGINSDLTMRASIPPLFMMFIMVYKYLFDEKIIRPSESKSEKEKNKLSGNSLPMNVRYVILIICLIVGAVTPCVEFARGSIQVKNRGIDDIYTDYIVTLNRTTDPLGKEWHPDPFVAFNYDTNPFFKYFSRIGEN